MNKVMLVGLLTRDPELRTLPSGKPVANFVIATNEFRGSGAAERTEYHNLVAWDRLAEICGHSCRRDSSSTSKGGSRRGSGTMTPACPSVK
jgi:single-strand DNA-binding protein